MHCRFLQIFFLEDVDRQEHTEFVDKFEKHPESERPVIAPGRLPKRLPGPIARTNVTHRTSACPFQVPSENIH